MKKIVYVIMLASTLGIMLLALFLIIVGLFFMRPGFEAISTVGIGLLGMLFFSLLGWVILNDAPSN